MLLYQQLYCKAGISLGATAGFGTVSPWVFGEIAWLKPYFMLDLVAIFILLVMTIYYAVIGYQNKIIWQTQPRTRLKPHRAIEESTNGEE